MASNVNELVAELVDDGLLEQKTSAARATRAAVVADQLQL
jgi:hypothetical protein